MKITRVQSKRYGFIIMIISILLTWIAPYQTFIEPVEFVLILSGFLFLGMGMLMHGTIREKEYLDNIGKQVQGWDAKTEVLKVMAKPNPFDEIKKE